MYGSSLRTETARPRALRSRPTEAAVMPFPREEVTPPVTKTYFAIWLALLRGVFPILRMGGLPSKLARSRERRAAGRRPGRRTGCPAARSGAGPETVLSDRREPRLRPVAAGRSGRVPRLRCHR